MEIETKEIVKKRGRPRRPENMDKVYPARKKRARKKRTTKKKIARHNTKTFMFYVPDMIHAAVQQAAKERGCTVTAYILRAIVAKINLERQHKDRINY